MSTTKRQIGQSAVLNGQTVLWSGENYGWQTPGSFNQLKEKGKFKVGAQALDRIASAVKRRIGEDNIKQMTRGADLATKPLQVLTGLLEQTPTAVGAVSRAQSGLGQLQNQAVGAVSDRTNVDPRIVQGAVTASELALGSAGGLRRGARRITPPTRQSTGAGIPNRIRGRLNQRRGEVGAIGDVHSNQQQALASARRDNTSIQLQSNGQWREVQSGIDQSPEAVINRGRISAQQTARRQATGGATPIDLTAPNQASRGDRPGYPSPSSPQANQRIQQALGRRDTSASGYVQDIPKDAYREAQGAIKNPISIPDINDRTQTVAQGFISDLNLQPGESLPGYQVSKPYVARGDSGSASRSMSKPILNFIIKEFKETNPRSGAVLSTGKGKRELLRAGTKDPSERYIRDRYNQLIEEINRRNGAQSPYGTKQTNPRQSTKPSDVRVSQETPDQAQTRVGRATDRRRLEQQRTAQQQVRRIRGTTSEMQLPDESRNTTPSRLRSRRAEQDLPDRESDVGFVPQQQNLESRGRKQWTPPRRFKNESSEDYARRIVEAKTGKKLDRLSNEQVKQLMEQLNIELPRGSGFARSGELQGTRIRGRGTGRNRGRSAQQERQAEQLRSGKARSRSAKENAEIKRIRSRRQRNR